MIENLMREHDVDPWMGKDPVVITIGGLELTAHSNEEIYWWVSSKTWSAVRGSGGRPTLTYWDESALCMDFMQIAHPGA